MPGCIGATLVALLNQKTMAHEEMLYWDGFTYLLFPVIFPSQSSRHLFVKIVRRNEVLFFWEGHFFRGGGAVDYLGMAFYFRPLFPNRSRDPIPSKWVPGPFLLSLIRETPPPPRFRVFFIFVLITKPINGFNALIITCASKDPD